jgi:hypothetical protein
MPTMPRITMNPPKNLSDSGIQRGGRGGVSFGAEVGIAGAVMA